ncbi:MAG TPA: Ig-like domain-containing protein [Bacteroidales bacterium]|nr:Ig-like domain-containing protein [Bacteroidales bacterium]
MKRNMLKTLAIALSIALTIQSCKKDDKDVAVTGVQLDETIEARMGATTPISATILPVDASNKSVSWISRNESIVTVANGVLTPVSQGTTTVVVKTSEGNFTDSCKVIVVAAVGATDTIQGNITVNRLIKADVKNIVKGWVYVKDGVTLTIEAGAVLRGHIDSKASIIVERGGKIIAEGSAQKPIIFSSNKPIGSRQPGDIGGIILCGKAPINVAGGEAEIEGGVGSKYGGNNPADNSGVLKYVRIEYPGYAFAPDKEINGLTMGGVGNGTTIDYVQVSYSYDDAYEWFGGNVNCKHLITLGAWDDDFDTDYGFSGTVQYGVSLRDANLADKSKSNGFESDNDGTGSSNTPITNPKFCNISIYGPRYDAASTINSNYQAAMHIRRKSNLEVYNSVFAGFPKGILFKDSQGNAGTGAQIKNCIIASMGDNYSGNTAGEEAFFTDASRSNRALANYSDLVLATPFNATAPNFLPQANSPLLTGAATTLPAGLTVETFVGAFGATDWTAGWANWNPQQSTY